MNHESLPSYVSEAERGVEKRREVAVEIGGLIDSAPEAAEKLIEDQGGVDIRGRIVPLEPGSEHADMWFTETHLILEAIEQKKLAAEDRGDVEAAKQLALAQDFFEHYHGTVADYLDALKNYPEIAMIIKQMLEDFSKRSV